MKFISSTIKLPNNIQNELNMIASYAYITVINDDSNTQQYEPTNTNTLFQDI